MLDGPRVNQKALFPSLDLWLGDLREKLRAPFESSSGDVG